jgi:hypothetical protein
LSEPSRNPSGTFRARACRRPHITGIYKLQKQKTIQKIQKKENLNKPKNKAVLIIIYFNYNINNIN